MLKMHYTTYPVHNKVSNDLTAIDAEPIDDYSLNHSPNFAILEKICYFFIYSHHCFHSLTYHVWKRLLCGYGTLSHIWNHWFHNL